MNAPCFARGKFVGDAAAVGVAERNFGWDCRRPDKLNDGEGVLRGLGVL